MPDLENARFRRCRTFATAVALFAAATAASSAIAQTPAQMPALTGTATYLERMALPPDAAFEATVRDVTRPDRPAELIGRTRIEPVQALPIRFAIPYDPNLVKYGNSYTLQARIVADGRLLFATVDPIPVFVDGRATPVDITLPRSSGVAVEELPPPPAPPALLGPSTSPPPRFVAPGVIGQSGGQAVGALGPLPATFTGVLPCADCSGIRHVLALDPAGPFTLQIQYLGRRGDPGYNLRGRWLYDAAERTLTLSTDRERPLAFAVKDASTLRLLDAAGREIVSDLNYDLTRDVSTGAAPPTPAGPPPASPFGAAAPAYPAPAYSGTAPGTSSGTTYGTAPAPRHGAPTVLSAPGASSASSYLLRGLFRSDSGGSEFAECGGGQPLPVAIQGEGAQLDSAYRRASSLAGEPVLVEVEGRIAFGPLPSGDRLGRILVVDRFIGLRPGESCSPAEVRAAAATPEPDGTAPAPQAATVDAPPDAPLRNTYWKLTRIGSQSAAAAPGQEAPSLVLNPDIRQFSGHGGCNGLGGEFFLDGHYLTFSLGPSTLMACDGGMEQERAFRSELARTEGWSVAGDRLTLYDADGTAILRFQAGYQ